ncbi:regulator of telomere elongation helicase 1 [Engraulis encrasicolus]|uniref:regulator of telomere elongation helicase 1 n=1 Tax=Engraulis encrasicolus TaxID=184585 RepID=UPI002FD7181F
MPHLKINGVTVDFPFTPYPCQTDYMTKVLECLENKKNGVLESPTGTGKTLCLLCATLAWRQHFKDNISARKIAERIKSAESMPSWGTTATDGETTMYYSDVPKIIYASRTHSQLTQVIGELRSTSYSPKVCVLGSREQLCINPEVMKQETNHVKVHMCRAKVSTRSCVFYNNVEEKSTDKEIINSILDVEDLVKAGNKQRVCPYYLARNLKQQAEIIFTPYNYLLDPKSRRAHNIELQGAVIIFDEAHNVEKMCEEVTSFDLTPYDLTSALQAVDKVLHELVENSGKEEDFTESSSSSALKLDAKDVATVKQVIMDLEMSINSYELQPNSKGLTKPGSFIYELFQKAQVNFQTKTAVAETIDQITGYLSNQSGIFLNTNGLQKLGDIIQLVFAGFTEEPSQTPTKELLEKRTQQFKVHIHVDSSNAKKKQTDIWAPTPSRKQGNVLSYWCFSPGFSMQELVRQGVRSLILTSGTLSPLSSFTAEMQIDFPVSLENPHVIQRDQIFVSIIDKGPDGTFLSSAFDRRFLPENMSSLGNTVVNLTRVVPDGLLVFFPSYPVMDKTLEFWRGNGQAERIESIKPMFVEPRGKGTFTEVIDGYYERVNEPSGRGGSFFAVCRGKASEGLDFANSYGRGVIITGLPFPPFMDPRVTLKMKYLDEMCRKKVPGVKYLSGQDWYRQQASRAVNQAIGRVIRHREDYGAIFLCDQRFKGTDARAQLPSWVRPYVKKYDNFGCMVRDVAQFFRVAQKLRPLPEKKPPPVPMAPGLCGGSSSSLGGGDSCRGGGAISCSSSQKAKTLDSHVPSLKRRRIDSTEMGGGVARLCVQYEAEIPTNQRRAQGLLDALENTEHSGPMRSDTHIQERLEELPSDVTRSNKRKIRLVQRPSTASASAAAASSQRSEATERSWKGHEFLVELKRHLSQESFSRLMEALKAYKQTDNLMDFIAKAAALLTPDPNTHRLLRGLYQAVRPHHKKRFHEQCVILTGEGCCYKPEHSLSKDEKRALTTHKGSEASSGPDEVSASASASAASLPVSSSTSAAASVPSAAASRSSSSSSASSAAASSELKDLMGDVQRALGPSRAKELFSCLTSYRKTQLYDQMVTTVVGILSEKDEYLPLLKRLEVFIPKSDRIRFKDMISSLTGGSDEQDSQPTGTSQPRGNSQTSQTKISTFFTGQR